jgi:transposase
VKDWAEVHRLHEREGKSERTIARDLKMSHNTVHRLLMLPRPPIYERSRPPSMLDPHRDAILAMLEKDATAPATVMKLPRFRGRSRS